ncbi:MAG: hypothetical protein KJ053_05075 [Dehalococcoidia bacterium]|nr:hypothetical protein [Dehalococcoidia bacterium]
MRLDARTGLVILAVGLAAVLPLVACGGDDDTSDTPTPDARTSSPATTTATSPPTTVTPSPEDEVLDAYSNYWSVYAAALRDRDSSHLAEVMTGPRLDRGLQEVADLEAQGRAIALMVESDPVVLEVRGDQALIADEYQNNSYYIDPETKQPVGATPSAPETLKDTVTMERIDGVWKVRDGVREESGQ